MAVEQLANFPSSTLSGGIDDTQTSLSVASGASFPATGVFRLRIEDEVIKVTSVSGTTFTVVRGDAGTTADSHANAITVTGVVTKEALETFRSDYMLYGAYASLPTAGVAGRTYKPTDQPVMLRDNGSAWVGYHSDTPDFTTPDFSSYAWNNQGSATISTSGWGGYITCPTNGNTSVWRNYEKSYSAPKKWTVAFTGGFQTSNSGAVGLGLRNNSSGKLSVCYFWAGGGNSSIATVAFEHYNSNTSFNSQVFGTASVPLLDQKLMWMQMEDDNTNITVRFSKNGLDWMPMKSPFGRTSFASGYDRFCLTINPYDQAIGMRIYSLKEE